MHKHDWSAWIPGERYYGGFWSLGTTPRTRFMRECYLCGKLKYTSYKGHWQRGGCK